MSHVEMFLNIKHNFKGDWKQFMYSLFNILHTYSVQTKLLPHTNFIQPVLPLPAFKSFHRIGFPDPLPADAEREKATNQNVHNNQMGPSQEG